MNHALALSMEEASCREIAWFVSKDLVIADLAFDSGSDPASLPSS